MNLSQTEEYALRAVLSIAAARPAPIRASRLARELELPRNYLGKTLTTLVGAGILSSSRGTTGGFRLAKSPRAITLSDIRGAFTAVDSGRCLLGLGFCAEHPECAVHHRWAPAGSLVSRFFDTTTVADLISIPGGSAPLCPAP